MGRLRRVDCSEPGITRRRRGRGFEFLAAGRRAGSTTRRRWRRIRELAIPPAWEDVWICTHPRGHLQATGVDAAGPQAVPLPRRLAHAARPAEVRRDARVRGGAAAAAARRASGTSAADGLGRDRVLAAAVRLLDRGMFRIGSEDYAEQNKSYGLATLLQGARHSERHADALRLSGQERPAARPVGRRPGRAAGRAALKRRRGGSPELLAYREGRRWVDVTSADINDYVKERDGRRLLGQGLPDLERDGARGRRARRARCRRRRRPASAA